jgi:hypothetical protein
LRSALTTAILAALTGTVAAGSFTRGCAARDMQILKMVEQSENSNVISTDQSRDAMLTMMHARIVCHEGYVMDALAIYDKIAQSIGANPILLGRKPSTEIQ